MSRRPLLVSTLGIGGSVAGFLVGIYVAFATGGTSTADVAYAASAVGLAGFGAALAAGAAAGGTAGRTLTTAVLAGVVAGILGWMAALMEAGLTWVIVIAALVTAAVIGWIVAGAHRAPPTRRPAAPRTTTTTK